MRMPTTSRSWGQAGQERQFHFDGVLALVSQGVHFQAGNCLRQLACQHEIGFDLSPRNGPASLRCHGPFRSQRRVLGANDDHRAWYLQSLERAARRCVLNR